MVIQYRDFTIPKGSTILANTWGIFHSNLIFKNPDIFDPERFIEDPASAKIIELVYGSGRRICPGINLARNSITINTMNLIWGFNFNKACDDNGNEIELDLWNYAEGLSTFPCPFKCIITPRSPEHAETVRNEFRESREAFTPFEHNLSTEDKAYVRELWESLR